MTGSLGATSEAIASTLREFFVAERIAAADGFLQSRDPRATLAGIVGLIVATMLTRSPFVLAGMGAVVLGLAAASAVPFVRLLKRSAVVPLATVLIVAPQLVVQPGAALVTVAGVSVTTGGVAYVLLFTSRVAVAVALVSLLVLTTPFSSLVAAARRLGVPTPIVWIVAVTYRYLFLLFDELHRLLLARNSRSADGRETGIRDSWRDARRLTGTFLLRSLDRGERVGRGMRARGGSRPPSPYATTAAFDRIDYAFTLAAVVAIVVSGVVRWGL